MALVVKNPPANAGDAGDSGLIPGSGRSSGEGNDYPFQDSSLENSINRVARWGWATGHGITKSQRAWLSIPTHTQIVWRDWSPETAVLIMSQTFSAGDNFKCISDPPAGFNITVTLALERWTRDVIRGFPKLNMSNAAIWRQAEASLLRWPFQVEFAKCCFIKWA